MTIIRGETVSEIALLNASGELLSTEKQEFVDLVEEECRKAFQKGQEKGEKIGYQKGIEESKVLFDLLQTMTRKVLEHKDRLLDHLKPEIIEFAMAVCERVIRSELEHPPTFEALIHALLEGVKEQNVVRILVAPSDLEMIEQRVKGVKFVPDPLMRRGDCRIELSSGLLNYDIARELSDLQAKVLQR